MLHHKTHIIHWNIQRNIEEFIKSAFYIDFPYILLKNIGFQSIFFFTLFEFLASKKTLFLMVNSGVKTKTNYNTKCKKNDQIFNKLNV